MRKKIFALSLLILSALCCGCGKEGKTQTEAPVVSTETPVVSTETPSTEITFDLTESEASTDTETAGGTSSDDISMKDVEDKVDIINGLINENFLFKDEEINKEEGIYKGLLESLGDPYSVYYTKEEFDELLEDNSGIYEGIGVQVSQNPETKIITVTKVFKGSPAEEAGVMREDRIAGVGDYEFNGEDVADVVKKIRGPEGTTVELKVYRPSIKDYVTMTVGRAKLENPTVEYEVLDGGIGLIRVTQFDDVTLEQYKSAIDALEAQNIKSLIVDVRDNPGGLVSTVTGMLDYMLPEGLLLYTIDRDGNRTNEVSSTDAHTFDKPVVVLANENSASASEIFAGAMKDRGAATVVGKNTFGKGIVQKIFPLTDGTGIKLTISKYYTPSGNEIHKVGIKPDIEVDLPEELATQSYIEKSDDTQLQKAIEVLKK